MLNHRLPVSSESGFITLLMSLIIFFLIVSVSLYSGYALITQQRVITQQNNQALAFQAAEAGLDYALAYFNANQSTILTALGTTVGTISNLSAPTINNHGSTQHLSFGTLKYTLTATSPQKLITISATGSSYSDSTISTTLTRQIAFASGVSSLLNNTAVTKGSITMGGSSVLINRDSTSVAIAGGTITAGNKYYCVAAICDNNNSGYINTSGNATLANQSTAAFFSNIFPTTTLAALIAGGTTSTSTNSLPTATGNRVIYVDLSGTGTLTLTGNGVYGSTTSPIILIVNGNLSLKGTVNIYGLVYIIGTSDYDSNIGNTFITGAVASEGGINQSGNATIEHSSTTLNNISVFSATYPAVSGSWKDFKMNMKGFILIEVLIAVLIISIGIAGMLILNNILGRTNANFKQYIEATNIARNDLETQRNNAATSGGYTAIASSGPSTQTPLSGDNTTFTVNRYVTTNNSPAYKVVDVIVSWTDNKNNSNSVELWTVITYVDPAAAGAILV